MIYFTERFWLQAEEESFQICMDIGDVPCFTAWGGVFTRLR